MFGWLNWLFWALCSWFGAIALLSYIVPFVITTYLLPVQNLKSKYDAKWALVTGASSGIGLAIVERLAKQGINVVMVALDDDVLVKAAARVRKQFSAIEVRAIGVNLGSSDGYMRQVSEGTSDIDVQLLFNNAGFITTGFFADSSVARLQANVHCNAACQVPLTHHFVNRMISKKLRGAVFFTSSPAFVLANPFSAMYGATKAFVTEFGASLAPELKEDNIDVLVVHPSPVTTSFYENAHDIDTINMFKKTGVTPDSIAAHYFSAVGRVVVLDQGYFAFGAKILVKLVSFNLLALIIKQVVTLLPDYKVVKKQSKRKTN